MEGKKDTILYIFDVNLCVCVCVGVCVWVWVFVHVFVVASPQDILKPPLDVPRWLSRNSRKSNYATCK